MILEIVLEMQRFEIVITHNLVLFQEISEHNLPLQVLQKTVPKEV